MSATHSRSNLAVPAGIRRLALTCAAIIALCAVLAASLAAVASASFPPADDPCSMTVRHATKGAPLYPVDSRHRLGHCGLSAYRKFAVKTSDDIRSA